MEQMPSRPLQTQEVHCCGVWGAWCCFPGFAKGIFQFLGLLGLFWCFGLLLPEIPVSPLLSSTGGLFGSMCGGWMKLTEGSEGHRGAFGTVRLDILI